MFKLIKNFIYNTFNSNNIKSENRDIYTVYNYDHSVPVPGICCWNNVWGFQDDKGYWYACVDMRCFGIRVQDIVVKCQDLSVYKMYLKLCESSAIINAVFSDDRLIANTGDKVNINFVFHHDGDTKEFNIHNNADRYAYEKGCMY